MDIFGNLSSADHSKKTTIMTMFGQKANKNCIITMRLDISEKDKEGHITCNITYLKFWF